MSNADFRSRALESVKKAIESDVAGDYEKAYQQYCSSREWKQNIDFALIHADSL